jgi:hypothetical protein
MANSTDNDWNAIVQGMTPIDPPRRNQTPNAQKEDGALLDWFSPSENNATADAPTSDNRFTSSPSREPRKPLPNAGGRAGRNLITRSEFYSLFQNFNRELKSLQER